MTDSKEFKEFKTLPCKKCKRVTEPVAINFLCTGYHGDFDRRRNLATQAYSPAYLEDKLDPAHCMNYVEYLYHPENYRTEKCPGNCTQRFVICPYYHTSKQAQQKRPNRNGLLSKCERDLDELEKYLRRDKKEKKQPKENILQPSTKQSTTSTSESVVASNPTVFSAIGLMKSDSFNEIIHGFQSPSSYRFNDKVSFREDRKHQFKSFVKINLKIHVPLIFEYMCAFQNCQGGTLYIGIDDDGYVVGVPMIDKEIDRLLLEIDQGCKMHFRPPIMPQQYHVTFVPVKGQKNFKDIVSTYVIEIQIRKDHGDDQLYLYNRECYMRMNASTHRLLAAQIIENERVKNQRKMEKELAEYKAIMSANDKYFSRLPKEELNTLRQTLLKSVETITKLGEHQAKRV